MISPALLGLDTLLPSINMEGNFSTSPRWDSFENNASPDRQPALPKRSRVIKWLRTAEKKVLFCK